MKLLQNNSIKFDEPVKLLVDPINMHEFHSLSHKFKGFQGRIQQVFTRQPITEVVTCSKYWFRKMSICGRTASSHYPVLYDQYD